MSQLSATPGSTSSVWGFLLTSPSNRAVMMWFSGIPLVVWGSRPCGSAPLPLWRTPSLMPSSTRASRPPLSPPHADTSNDSSKSADALRMVSWECIRGSAGIAKVRLIPKITCATAIVRLKAADPEPAIATRGLRYRREPRGLGCSRKCRWSQPVD